MSKRAPSPHRVTSRRRRALGQHFLSNLGAARRILGEFAAAPSARIVEIGPGRGVLTALLLESGATVTAVEIDPGLAARLRERFAGQPAFTLVEADILRCDIAGLAGGGPARVLANLPYSITGPVLMRLFDAAHALTDMTLMLQREVVNRIVAGPGSRTYGSLSVVAQYFTRPRVVMSLGPGSFSPPPAVSSTVVTMPFRTPRELSPEAERAYRPFVREIFAHRRQTLLNNLKAAGARVAGGGDLARKLADAGIDPRRRPETLDRQECLRLYGLVEGVGIPGLDAPP